MQSPTPLTLPDRLMVALWRHSLTPFFSLLNSIPAPSERITELKYGDLPAETLDIITPKAGVTPRLPVVFIHGGGWVAGSKGRFYNRPLLPLADVGHPVFSLNYPLAPEYPHPQPLRSLLRALRTLKSLGHLPNGMHLVGDSAGGNLATMLGLMLTNPELLTHVEAHDPVTLPTVKSIVSLYGVMDRFTFIEDGFPSARLFLESYAGKTALDPAAPPIPITPMDLSEFSELPPTFVAGAGKDQLLRSSHIWAEHLSTRFPQVTYKVYEGAGHGFYCFPGEVSDQLRSDVTAFLSSIEIARS